MTRVSPVEPHRATRPLAACADCGLVYGSTGWVDVIIPTDVWCLVGPTGDIGGLLCFNCIARRLELWDLHDIPLMIGSGPFELTPQDPEHCTVCASPGTFGTTGRCLTRYVTPDDTGIGASLVEPHREGNE